MYNSNMNVLKKQKDEKIIKKILKNHFEEFKLKYWNKVSKWKLSSRWTCCCSSCY